MSDVEHVYGIVSQHDDPVGAANALYDAGYRFPIPTMNLEEEFIRRATVTGMATLMYWIVQTPTGDVINRVAAEALVQSGLFRSDEAAQAYSGVMEQTVTEEAPVEVDPNALVLTLNDRCEQCGAAALSQFDKEGEEEASWLFCGHHGREHRPKLESLGYTFRTIEVEWEPLKLHAEV